MKRGRPSEGLTENLGGRITGNEAQMLRDIAAQLGLNSKNRAVRWAIRYAWQHATSTTHHDTCGRNSTCASATLGITGGRQRTAPHVDTGQMAITHEATMESDT